LAAANDDAFGLGFSWWRWGCGRRIDGLLAVWGPR